jgi:hypothetical protein
MPDTSPLPLHAFQLFTNLFPCLLIPLYFHNTGNHFTPTLQIPFSETNAKTGPTTIGPVLVEISGDQSPRLLVGVDDGVVGVCVLVGGRGTGVFVFIGVRVAVGVREGVKVMVGVLVLVGVLVIVGVLVLVGVLVIVGVLVLVGVRVGV